MEGGEEVGGGAEGAEETMDEEEQAADGTTQKVTTACPKSLFHYRVKFINFTTETYYFNFTFVFKLQ